MRVLLLLCVLILSACGGGGNSATPGPVKRLAVAGDSITLRTGQCAATDTMQSCTESGRLPVDAAYSSYLQGPFDVAGNAGRGGDTCTDQAAYTDGPFKGQPRGLLNRIGSSVLVLSPNWTVVLIGVNDRGLFDVPLPAVVDCIAQVWAGLRAKGVEPIAATYPPMAPDTKVWGLSYGEGQKRALDLNAAVRLAAIKANVMLIELENVKPYSTTDGVHPDAAGAKAIAAEINRVLRGMA